MLIFCDFTKKYFNMENIFNFYQNEGLIRTNDGGMVMKSFSNISFVAGGGKAICFRVVEEIEL